MSTATSQRAQTSRRTRATLDSTTLANGSHTLVAWAYDAADNIGKSAAVRFSVSNASTDTTAPTVSRQRNGQQRHHHPVNATATDNVGVTKVEFYVDGALNGSARRRRTA